MWGPVQQKCAQAVGTFSFHHLILAFYGCFAKHCKTVECKTMGASKYVATYSAEESEFGCKMCD